TDHTFNAPTTDMLQSTLGPQGQTGLSQAAHRPRQYRASLLAKRTYSFNNICISHIPALSCGMRWLAPKGPDSAVRQAAATSGAAVIGLTSSNKVSVQTCDALIVGAGPGGLGTALLLAQRQGWERVIILEKRPSIGMEESDKAYVYNIDWRGLSLVDAVGLTSAVEAVSIPRNFKPTTDIMPDGAVKEYRLPSLRDKMLPSVWLSRRAFLEILYSGLAEAEQTGRVQLLNNTEVTNIQLEELGGGAPIVVCACDTATGQEMRFAPRLLVGADGMNSDVRRALTEWAPKAGLPDDHFSPVVLDSPSSGLCFKSMPLPSHPTFRKMKTQPKSRSSPFPILSGIFGRPGDSEGAGDGLDAATHVPIDTTRVNYVYGVKAPPNRWMRLTIFPVGPATTPTATVAMPAGHVIWSLTSGPQLGAFLQESFPQLDIPSLFTEQQLDTIAASRGGAFPRPRFLRHFIAVLPPARDSTEAGLSTGADLPNGREGLNDANNRQIINGISISASAAAKAAPTGPAEVAPSAPAANPSITRGCGVALLGDAVHCFPPDLGQGVNSAAMDALALAKALDEASGDVARALPLYEARQAPEAAAIADIMRVGAPYQYRQSKIGTLLWMANFLLRMRLSQLAPLVFSSQVAIILAQTTLSYTEIWKRGLETTRRIWALAGAMVVMVATFLLNFAKASVSTGAMTAAAGV
ncbi:hypothetical protein Vretimale_10287, partial [Volvox reticuliferus]